jgi:hypothetical protein
LGAGANGLLTKPIHFVQVAAKSMRGLTTFDYNTGFGAQSA